MSIVVLTNDTRRWRSYNRTCFNIGRRTFRRYYTVALVRHKSWLTVFSSIGFSFSTQPYRQFKNALATSSISINYRTKLLGTMSGNERLERGVEALVQERRTNWRVTASFLHIVIGYLDDADHISEFNADVLFRCCGRLTPAARPERRLQYLKILWDSLPRLGITPTVDYYTKLQRCLLQNNQKFSPSAFLDRVRKAGFEPNVYLYLGSMIRCSMDERPNREEINFYANEAKKLSNGEHTLCKIQSVLVSAEAQLGNEDKVRSLIDEIKQQPNSETHQYSLRLAFFSVAMAAAHRGNTTKLFKVIDDARRENVSFIDYQYLYIAMILADVGRRDSVLRVLNYMPKHPEWIYRTLAFVLTLVANGHYVTALTVLQRSAASEAASSFQPMPTPTQVEPSNDDQAELLPGTENVYRFLMDLFYLDLPSAQITAFCRRLADCGYTAYAVQLATVAAFDAKRNDVGQALLAETSFRTHEPSSQRTNDNTQKSMSLLQRKHFSSALRFRSSLQDVEAVLVLLRMMDRESASPDVRTLASHVLPYFNSPSLGTDTLIAVFGTAVSKWVLQRAIFCVYLTAGDRDKVKECLSRFQNGLSVHPMTKLIESLSDFYHKTHDVDLMVEVLKLIKYKDEIKYQSNLESCLNGLFAFLRRRIGTDELEEFIDAISKAGINVPSRID